MLTEVNASIAAALAQPLSFSPLGKENAPALEAAGLATAAGLGLQINDVTTGVGQMELVSNETAPGSGSGCRSIMRRLFAATSPPLLCSPPIMVPTKMSSTVQPRRRSARQAQLQSSVPVAEWAMLQIVRQLGILGPKEKMTKEAAEAYVRRFDGPLRNDEIDGLAGIAPDV